jgi:hypothetical protein
VRQAVSILRLRPTIAFTAAVIFATAKFNTNLDKKVGILGTCWLEIHT